MVGCIRPARAPGRSHRLHVWRFARWVSASPGLPRVLGMLGSDQGAFRTAISLSSSGRLNLRCVSTHASPALP
eukprot:6594972-Lingulodinium_polyedra.AAC.1